MHVSPLDEDHAHALCVAVSFSSRGGIRVHSEFVCMSAYEAAKLEVLPGYGSDSSRRCLV